jgi:hypothetical protein
MSEKKMVRRSVAIALGILSIILVAGISGAIAYYSTTLNNSNALYNDYVLSHSHTDYDYNNLNATLDLVRSQVDDLTTILQLGKNDTVYPYLGELELPANFSTEPNIGEIGMVTNTLGLYAGIVYVHVSSTSNETYVNATYTAKDVFPQFNYSVQEDVGVNGLVAFPVLPAEIVNIRVAVHNPSVSARANVTMTFRY